MAASKSLPLKHVRNGVEYGLYEIEFDTPDGKERVYMHALSFEHASYLLDELKQGGEVVSVVVGCGRA